MRMYCVFLSVAHGAVFHVAFDRGKAEEFRVSSGVVVRNAASSCFAVVVVVGVAIHT